MSMLRLPDGLPCNPAHVPFQKKPELGIQTLLSNGYSSLSNVRKLIKGEINQELVDGLFSESKIIQIEASADINFKTNLFNARYTPLNVKGFSVVRNEANPDVELSIVEEEGFLFQSGYEVYPNFLIGAQVRTLQRKFIKKRFKLVFLGTSEGKDYLKPETQRALYLEPGFTWIFPKLWNFRVSGMYVNWGDVSKDYADFPIPPELQMSVGFSPPVPWGHLDFSIDYKSLEYDESGLEKIRLGMAYQFGAMHFSTGLDQNGSSAGIYYGLNQINAGVMFSTTRVLNENEEFFTQTVYVQLGWGI
ncbi:hypothetical protein GW916_05935 [bacterium]|nr:hypothetical protein [bacterium]